MHNLELWLKDELSDEEVHELAKAIDEKYPGIAEQIRETMAKDGPGADFLRSIPEFVDVDMFDFWEAIGVHMTPVHWSSPIANVQGLSDELWTEPSEMPAIDFRVDEQLDRLSTFKSRYRDEYSEFPIYERSEKFNGFAIKNHLFESVDTEVLYSMIRENKPKRVIEIGGGNSTQVASAALQKNDQRSEHLIIDPDPKKTIKGIDANLIQAKVQDVPMSVFNSLEEDDLLFIDSSHVGRIGSDVLYEYLDIIPRLDDGVLVHCHDIFFPYEYPKPWITQFRWFFNEQYLLRALLAGNDIEVLWATYYLHKEYPELLEEAFESYEALGSQYGFERPNGIPSSLWMRT
ncbi:class I SAM-dependent methyltransferase [Haloferax sp. AB510]|uniref:class I SAM-dependent methyltransferase n=1 Tax=Haloferax sp. AB510 TaxID=2934172 RepID=UPI00209BDB1F|nr:class I SAM-dependent methyltransferase [Haloferax sp. AB510]MCO8266563.1 class I SAM-dependent methyltransferase [Haloferax sp. AB510]